MKAVVITGANRGIGFELVKQFLNNSDLMVIAITHEAKPLIELNHHNLKIIAGDLITSYKSIIDEIKSTKPNIEVLFNNAAIVKHANILNLKDEDLLPTMDINFFTPLKLIRDLKPFLGNPSHIINISSMSGFQGSKKMNGLALYGASKAALASLTESVAVEYKEFGIFCNCIALGSVNTDMINISIPGLAAKINVPEIAVFLHDFALNGHKLCNGQVIPITLDDF